MTQPRRSLSSALPDQETVRAFVTQQEKSERPVSTPLVEPKESHPSRVEEPKSELPKKAKPKRKPTRLQPVGLIPVTVRLRPEVAGALKRASLERQLDGEDIFSQQDLVESALEPWLREEGYLD
tara:strand:+ start:539 stop:910 length:372 start_codon:yes stop_codon:yes gene_type:complete